MAPTVWLWYPTSSCQPPTDLPCHQSGYSGGKLDVRITGTTVSRHLLAGDESTYVNYELFRKCIVMTMRQLSCQSSSMIDGTIALQRASGRLHPEYDDSRLLSVCGWGVALIRKINSRIDQRRTNASESGDQAESMIWGFERSHEPDGREYPYGHSETTRQCYLFYVISFLTQKWHKTISFQYLTMEAVNDGGRLRGDFMITQRCRRVFVQVTM